MPYAFFLFAVGLASQTGSNIVIVKFSREICMQVIDTKQLIKGTEI